MPRGRNEELRRLRISEGLKLAYAEGRRKPICYMQGKHFSEESKRKISEAQKGKPKPAWLRQKYSLAKKGKPQPQLHNPETRQKVAESLRANQTMKRKWQDPEYRDKLLCHLENLNSSPKQKVNASKGGKTAWAKHRDSLLQHLERVHQGMDAEFYREIGLKGLKTLHAYPNKEEGQLLDILVGAFPDEWKYVGDGQVPIGNLRPDFINTNGKKLIIELFGDYWHSLDDEITKRAVYEDYGYSLLVIWTRELKKPESIINKVKEFMGVQNA